MARLEVSGDRLVVRLSAWERLGAVALAEPSAPLAAVRAVRVVERPWRELRGLRCPGTGLPGVVALGTWRGRGMRDFNAVYRSGPGVLVELEGPGFSRFLVSCADATAVAAHVSAAAPSR
jgi:hypothetical protein